MHVVVTAGHVDHGKSTLVHALTGSDPDRLVEERRRGLSIELGYCWTTLPEVGEVAFVDVPGHQRFVTTSLSGMGPVPVAMLVVAADDPWMPQAAEHLAALDALGVAHGMVVVTRSDLADPGPAAARARAEVDRTSLAGAPLATVSGRTGAGIDELRRTLGAVLASVPTPTQDPDVRLWVDRRFHVTGVGTVVTGTLPAGRLATGDQLEARTGGQSHQLRVRGLESLGTSRERVEGPARVAVNLAGPVPDAIGRGTPLVGPGTFHDSAVLDVLVHGGAGALPERPVLHVGSAHTEVHVRPLGDRHARLSLDHPLPWRLGDRALLRDPGTARIWGARVLDPDPPPLTRRGSAIRRAADLASYDASLAGQLRLRGLAYVPTLRRMGVPTDPPVPCSISAGDWVLGPERAASLREQLGRLVTERSTALRPGISTAAAARALGLPTADLIGALVTPPLEVRAGRVVEPTVELPPELAEPLARLRAALTDDPFAAPTSDDLQAMGMDPRTAAALHRAGAALRLGESVVLLPDAPQIALSRLATLDAPFTTSAARQALGTTRRVALPLLAHLDSNGATVRLPDDTRRVAGTGSGH